MVDSQATLSKEMRVIEALDEKREVSKRFVLSVIFSVIAVGLLTLVIGMTPVLEEQISFGGGGGDPSGSNFFYKWDYRYISYIDEYYLDWIRPSTGFFIFMPISMLLLTISGFGFLLGDFRETRRLIYANWLLYCLPLLASFIVGSLIYTQPGYFDVDDGMHTTFFLGLFYLLPFVFIQASLLLAKDSFRAWAGFPRKAAQAQKGSLLRRRINAGFFVLAYCWIWFYPVTLMIPQWDLWGLIYSFCGVYMIFTFWWMYFELGFRQIVLRGRRKEMISNTIFQGKHDLNAIAQQLTLSLEEVREVTRFLICRGKIQGEISKDGLAFIPKLEAMRKCPKERICGIISLGIAFVTIPSYSLMMAFVAWELLFVHFAFALLIFIGLILGAAATYYAVGGAGYMINALGILPVSCYIYIIILFF